MMGKQQKPLRKIARVLQSYLTNVVRWWCKQDRKYQVKWRLANACLALLIVLTVAIPVVQNTFTNRRYKLSQDTLNLVGDNNQALASKLKYNAQTQTYEFNKEAIKEYNPLDSLQKQVGSADEKTKLLYSLDVPTDPKKGVTYHDVNSQLSFKLIPQFTSLPGKTEQGRIVFPLDNGPQAVYTLKNNGLKEDIVVTDSKHDTLRFMYSLELPKSLEARQLPDGSGGIGLYAADPTLFSNMSYGSDNDRKLIEKARENAEKTNLVFGIPAPVIITKEGKAGTSNTRFELRGNQLTVVAENLKSIEGVYSIDPSVVITSATDFSNGNNEGNIDFSTSGQISRAGLTGGTVGSWGTATANSLITPRSHFGSVAYNGYIYLIGGRDANNVTLQSVEYAQISSNGTLSSNSCGTAVTWCSGGNTGRAASTLPAVAYNGYLYSFEGWLSTTAVGTDVRYARICDGTITTDGCSAGVNNVGKPGTWASANTGAAYSSRFGHGAVVYNGYMYVLGGCNSNFNGVAVNCVSMNNTIYRAAINAGGTLAAWSNVTPGTSFTARFGHGAVVYNGYMYVLGGCVTFNFTNCGSVTNNVSYAKINTDGSISDWQTTSQFTTARANMGTTVYNGYLYITQGCTNSDNGHCINSSGTPINDVQYAQIYANGGLGPWSTTNTLAAARAGHGTVFNSGYLYSVGGCSSSTCTAANVLATTQSTKIDSPGTITPFTPENDPISASPDGIRHSASVVYGGYMYAIGGITSASNNRSAVVHFTKLNADGTTSAWTASANQFTDGRANAAAVAYNGYLYIIGGETAGSPTTNCPQSGTQGLCKDIQKAQIDNSTGNVGTWSSAGSFYGGAANGRMGLGAIAYNGYIYVMGGEDGNSTITAQVDIGQIDISTGNIISWTNNASGMGSNARSRFGLAQREDQIYIVGGLSASTTLSATTFIATLTSGSISAFTSAGANFTTARLGRIAVVNNDYLYIAGGRISMGIGAVGSNDVQYIKLSSDGSFIGNWITSPVSITASTRLESMTAVYNGYLYVMGGCSSLDIVGGCGNAANNLKDVQYARINNGGSGSVTLSSETVAAGLGRAAFGTAVYNGYMYRIGGCTSVLFTNANTCASGSINDTVNYAQIYSDGTIDTWQSTTGLNTGSGVAARFGLAAVAYNGRLYAVGGCSALSGGNCTSFNSDVQYATINANGSLGASWAVAGSTFSTGRYGLSAIVSGGYLYVLGGCSAMSSDSCTTTRSDVQVSQLDSVSGLPGSWNSAGSDFVTGRFYQSAIIYNDTLYVLGGCSAVTSGNCTGIRGDVQYITIDTGTGLLSGGWSYTNSLPTARYGSTLTASNGYMYLIGGCTANSSGNCTSYLGDIQYAAILSGGGIQNWTTITNTSQKLATPRFLHGGAIVNGTLVIVGGNMSTNNFGTAQQPAVLNAQSRTGRYSKIIDLGVENGRVNNFLYNGSLYNGRNDISYRTATTALPAFTSSLIAPPLPELACTGASAVKTRYVLVTILLDDTYKSTFGESATSYVTDLTIRYNYIRPDPNIRLRLGQTLQQGDLSPFDTCGP